MFRSNTARRGVSIERHVTPATRHAVTSWRREERKSSIESMTNPLFWHPYPHLQWRRQIFRLRWQNSSLCPQLHSGVCCPFLPYPVLSCNPMSSHVLSCNLMASTVLPCNLMSSLVISCPLMPSPVSSCPLLSSHWVMASPVLFCNLMSSPVFSCPLLSSPALSLSPRPSPICLCPTLRRLTRRI